MDIVIHVEVLHKELQNLACMFGMNIILGDLSEMDILELSRISIDLIISEMMSNVTNVIILDTWPKIADMEVLQRNSRKVRMNKYGKGQLKGVLSLSRLKATEAYGMLTVVSQCI